MIAKLVRGASSCPAGVCVLTGELAMDVCDASEESYLKVRRRQPEISHDFRASCEAG